MRRRWPILLIAAGLILIVGGFIFDILFAGIPYQDPTPEMSANYERNSKIASTLRWLGLGSLSLGSMVSILRIMFARHSRIA